MSYFDIRQLVETLLFPPGLAVVLGLLVLFTANFKPRIAGKILFLGIFTLWLCSTSFFSFWLLDSLQKAYPVLHAKPADADVVVVLGGGSYFGKNEYGRSAMLADGTVPRALYGGYLGKHYGLPVITTGGRHKDEPETHARVMADFLRENLDVTRIIEEGKSLTTYENARESLKLMQQHGLRKPLLVTHGWHMRRGMESFQTLGVEAYAAPTAIQTPGTLDAGYFAWLPRSQNLERSRVALHEWLGLLYYRYRVFKQR